MRRVGGIIAAAALIIATAASAQENSAPSGQGFSPEDDLDCAIYIGSLLGADQEVATPDVQTALTSALTYFLGRYEAQRGTPINIALLERYSAFDEADAAEIEQTCGLRARGFAQRMQDAGRVMIQAGQAAAQQDDGTAGEAP